MDVYLIMHESVIDDSEILKAIEVNVCFRVHSRAQTTEPGKDTINTLVNSLCLIVKDASGSHRIDYIALRMLGNDNYYFK